MIAAWGAPATWVQDALEHPHEAQSLRLDISKAREQLSWAPRWNLEAAIEKIVQWEKAYQNRQDMKSISLAQIQSYTQP